MSHFRCRMCLWVSFAMSLLLTCWLPNPTVEAQDTVLTGQAAFKAYPLLVLEIEGVSPVAAAGFLNDVTDRSRVGRRWVSRTIRELMTHPFGLPVDVPRGRGFAYLWNPEIPALPAVAEYTCVLPSEFISPGEPVTQGAFARGDGEFKVTVNAPGRFTHSYYTSDIESTFDRDGRRRTIRILSPRPLFSNYFGFERNVLWKCSEPLLLTAKLPEIRPEISEQPALRLSFNPEAVPLPVRTTWLRAATAGLALSDQRRDAESQASWRQRLLAGRAIDFLLSSLLADGTKLSGTVMIEESGHVGGNFMLAASSISRVMDGIKLLPGRNSLTSVLAEDPWFSLWIGIRPTSDMAESILQIVGSELTVAEESSDHGLQLLSTIMKSSEFQIILAGVTEADGSSGMILGIRNESADRIRDLIDSGIKRCLPMLQPLVSHSNYAVENDGTILWAVAGTADPHSMVERIQSRNIIQETRSPGELLHLELDFSRISRPSAWQQSPTPLADGSQPLHLLASVTSVLGAIARLHTEKSEQTQPPDFTGPDYWTLRANVSASRDAVRMNIHSGLGASMAITAAGLAQIEVLRAAGRKQP